jgi:Family of unknown function (DUF6519)
MKSDNSRNTFDPRKHFRSVRLQQGRVQIDADGNEENDIVSYRVETEAHDVIGWCGAPLHYPAFHIVGALSELSAEEKALPGNANAPKITLPDFLISAGRYYVDGVLCENETLTTYLTQPDFPSPPPITEPGLYLIYVDVWQRLLTALDDASIREVALGGPDTAAREKTIWQIKYVATEKRGDCQTEFEAYNKVTAASTGKMSARSKRPDESKNPCVVPSSAGYTGLENAFYRVELHNGGEALDATTAGTVAARISGKNNQLKFTGAGWTEGQAIEIFSSKDANSMNGVLAFITQIDGNSKTVDIDVSKLSFDELRVRPASATFKWSRDNGAVVTSIDELNDEAVTVHDLGPDNVIGFQVGDWVEVSDDILELAGKPGWLAQIVNIERANNLITLDQAVTLPQGLIPARHPKLRRWNGIGAVKFHPKDQDNAFVDLENGVQVKFFEGTFKTGDYWTIAARTANADAQSGKIEWPQADNKPAKLSPFGITHHYCRLAMANWNGSKFKFQDCRNLFAPITEQTNFVYVNGAGQESMPGQPQPQALQAGVFNDRWAVAGVKVKFTASDKGQLSADTNGLPASMPAGAGSVTVETGADGVASCAWTLDPDVTKPSQRVEARLLDANGEVLDPIVRFDGNLSLAKNVFYDPSKCPGLKGDKVNNVQDAIDHLCEVHQGGGCDVTVGKGGDFEKLEEAIKKLLGLKRSDLCICLMPGDHMLEEGLTIEAKGVNLKIVGCGRGSRLLFPSLNRGNSFVAQGLASLILRDLEMSGSNFVIQLDQCNDIDIEKAYLIQEDQTNPFIRIVRADRVRLEGNLISATQKGASTRGPAKVFESDPKVSALFKLPSKAEFDKQLPDVAAELAARPSAGRKTLVRNFNTALAASTDLTATENLSYRLALRTLGTENVDAAVLAANLQSLRAATLRATPGVAVVLFDGEAETRIEDNQITGSVSLYGMPGKTVLTQAEIRTIAAALRVGKLVFNDPLANLHLRNNVVTRMDVSEETIALLRGVNPNTGGTLDRPFSRCFFTNNVFSAGNSVFVMDHIALTANSFDDNKTDAGFVIANGAIYTGNYATNDIRLFNAARASQKAANLLINIVDVT